MGIRLVGLKSTGMTSANAQNRGIGWGKNPVGRGQNSSCSLMNTKHTYTHTHMYTTHTQACTPTYRCAYIHHTNAVRAV